MGGTARFFGFLTLFAAVSTIGIAQAGQVKVKSNTKFYTISGKSAFEFAASMSRRGPYSRQHRQRAWATAARDLTYQLSRKKTRYGCRVTDADVSLKVTYTMPKLRRTRGISTRELQKWRKMYKLLDVHEKRHGQLYKAFASKLHRELRKLKTAKTCRQLDRKAAKLVAKLADQDSDRNDRFDARDGRNYRRMTRLYKR